MRCEMRNKIFCWFFLGCFCLLAGNVFAQVASPASVDTLDDLDEPMWKTWPGIIQPALEGDLEAVKECLEKNGKIDGSADGNRFEDRYGRSFVDLVQMQGRKEILSFLVAKGAKPSAEFLAPPTTTTTPLNIFKSLEIIRDPEAFTTLSDSKKNNDVASTSGTTESDWKHFIQETTYIRLDNNETSVSVNLVKFPGYSGAIRLPYVISKIEPMEFQGKGSIIQLRSEEGDSEWGVLVWLKEGKIEMALPMDLTAANEAGGAKEDSSFNIGGDGKTIDINIYRKISLKKAVEYINNLQGNKLSSNQEKAIKDIDAYHSVLVTVSTAYQVSQKGNLVFRKETMTLKSSEPWNTYAQPLVNWAYICHVPMEYLVKLNPTLQNTVILEDHKLFTLCTTVGVSEEE